jgi:hypothetical protein
MPLLIHAQMSDAEAQDIVQIENLLEQALQRVVAGWRIVWVGQASTIFR